MHKKGDDEVKGSKLLRVVLSATVAAVLVGCSKPNTDIEPVSASDIQMDTQNDTVTIPPSEDEEIVTTTEETAAAIDEIAVADEMQETIGAIATVVVNFVYDEGTPDTIEYLNIDGVSGQPDETGDIIYGKDGAGNLIYKREDTGFTDGDGRLNVTTTYEFYSLDYDFDLSYEPMEPENGGDIQSITGGIYRDQEISEFTWETVGIRSYTGIWYAGICSCRDGSIGSYIAE